MAIVYSIYNYPYSTYLFRPYVGYDGNILSQMFNWCDNKFGSVELNGNIAISRYFYTIGDGINGFDLKFRFKKQNDKILFDLTWG